MYKVFMPNMCPCFSHDSSTICIFCFASCMESGDLDSLPDVEMAIPDGSINQRTHRFPHCLVWTPLPIIT